MNTASLFFHGTTAPSRPRHPHYRGFTITSQQAWTPPDECLTRRRDIYLTTYNNNNNNNNRQTDTERQASLPPPGFEPAIPASERLQTHALDRAASRNGKRPHTHKNTVFLSNAVKTYNHKTRSLFTKIVFDGTLEKEFPTLKFRSS